MKVFRNTRCFNSLVPEVEIDMRSLNIIPLFDIHTLSFDLDKSDLSRTLPKNKTARRILINKSLIEYRYYSDNILEYDYTYLKSKYVDFKERLKQAVYKIFKDKVNFINLIVNTNIPFNEKVYINTNLISDNFQFRGNNTYIKSNFDNFLTKKAIRNGEKLAIYFGSVFKEVSEGIYPVLLSGIDASKIDSFKLNLINTLIYEPTDFNSVKVYVDKDWYLESCNKSLKTYLLKSLNEKYYNYELILFDGKEFANQNMFSYQPISLPTLAKRKKYFSDIEAKLYEYFIKNNYSDNFDYKAIQKEFLDKYNQLLEDNIQKTKDNAKIEPEISETRSLTSEEMSLIDSLFYDDVEEPVQIDVEVPVLDLVREEAVSQIDNTFADLEEELRRIANEIQNG